MQPLDAGLTYLPRHHSATVAAAIAATPIAATPTVRHLTVRLCSSSVSSVSSSSRSVRLLAVTRSSTKPGPA